MVHGLSRLGLVQTPDSISHHYQFILAASAVWAACRARSPPLTFCMPFPRRRRSLGRNLTPTAVTAPLPRGFWIKILPEGLQQNYPRDVDFTARRKPLPPITQVHQLPGSPCRPGPSTIPSGLHVAWGLPLLLLPLTTTTAYCKQLLTAKGFPRIRE